MKIKRLFALTLMIAVVVSTMLCIPSTNAKYAKSEVYRLRVKTNIYVAPTGPVICKKDKSSSPTDRRSSIEYTTEEEGYYVIIAKGGDGAEQMEVKSSIFGNASPAGNGGVGGLIVSKVHLGAGEKIISYVGCAGSDGTVRGSYRGSGGAAGNNALGVASGGAGGDRSATTSAVSGGGGAATLVLYGNNAKNTMDNVMIIAGGGGSGGSYDTGGGSTYDHGEGVGGKGGSNYGSNGLPTPQILANYGLVYAGTNGGGNKYGIAGSLSAGSGSGAKGSLYTSGGSGGSVDKNNSSGAGGGGYAGGAAGKDDSKYVLAIKNYYPGGGGGGSSYLATTKYGMQSFSDGEVINTILADAGYSITNKGGFVVIAYIGKE